MCTGRKWTYTEQYYNYRLNPARQVAKEQEEELLFEMLLFIAPPAPKKQTNKQMVFPPLYEPLKREP